MVLSINLLVYTWNQTKYLNVYNIQTYNLFVCTYATGSWFSLSLSSFDSCLLYEVPIGWVSVLSPCLHWCWFVLFFSINWTVRMSDNLPERVQILGHAHIICITVRENRIICSQIFCDLLLKSGFERICNVMQLILVKIKWKYLIQWFHDICLSYLFFLKLPILTFLSIYYPLIILKTWRRPSTLIAKAMC
jgi:hypothetical protein